MKLNEATLKKLILEVMTETQAGLPHLEKLAKLFADGPKQANQAVTFIEGFPEWMSHIEKIQPEKSSQRIGYNFFFKRTPESLAKADEFEAALKKHQRIEPGTDMDVPRPLSIPRTIGRVSVSDGAQGIGVRYRRPEEDEG